MLGAGCCCVGEKLEIKSNLCSNWNLRVICVKFKKPQSPKSIELANCYVYYLWAQAIKMSALLLLSNCRENGLKMD